MYPASSRRNPWRDIDFRSNRSDDDDDVAVEHDVVVGPLFPDPTNLDADVDENARLLSL
jgi:hypothetical protein